MNDTQATTWRPASGAAVAMRRAALLQGLRDYFADSAVLPVDTPSLSSAAASDPQIESLAVASQLSRTPLYLHTSPEFCMKRLLAAGFPDIYSIVRVYRDGESGQSHQPEFTLAEWYRLNFGLQEIIDDTIAAICAAVPRLKDLPVTVHSYQQVFIESVGLDPLQASSEDLAAAATADHDLRAAIGTQRDAWLDLLLARAVIPQFAADTVTVLMHYPASQAALARLCPGDPRVADRFEVFCGGQELANGYVELTDAGQQLERMHTEQALREMRGLPTRPLDAGLITALQHGLPPCAGVALGIERLHMVADRTNDIRDVITFAFGAYGD